MLETDSDKQMHYSVFIDYNITCVQVAIFADDVSIINWSRKDEDKERTAKPEKRVYR